MSPTTAGGHSPPSPDPPSEETRHAIDVWLSNRRGWTTINGIHDGDGPLEGRIDPVRVQIRGEGLDAEFEIIFSHRAFPGKRFGLRTGQLWRPVLQDSESWLDAADPEDNAARLGSWAEDYPTLNGLPGDDPPDADGVIWIETTYRDQLSGIDYPRGSSKQ